MILTREQSDLMAPFLEVRAALADQMAQAQKQQAANDEHLVLLCRMALASAGVPAESWDRQGKVLDDGLIELVMKTEEAVSIPPHNHTHGEAETHTH